MSDDIVPPDPDALCPASGLTNKQCQASICDCFPDGPRRFDLHPERFIVNPRQTALIRQVGTNRPFVKPETVVVHFTIAGDGSLTQQYQLQKEEGVNQGQRGVESIPSAEEGTDE